MTSDITDYLRWAYHELNNIFNPHKFTLQQFAANSSQLKEEIDLVHSESQITEQEDPFNVRCSTKQILVQDLLELKCDRVHDCVFTDKLDLKADVSTKRQLLSTYASQFDIFNFNNPLLNRTRLFLHKLQCDQNLNWYDPLPDEFRREWRNISTQVHAVPILKFPRAMGSRNHVYRIITFTDSSKLMLGCVSYLLNLNTNEPFPVLSKSRVVNKNLESKSIPSLELQAPVLGTECSLDIYKEFSGSSCICSISIESLFVYSDSLVVLN